MDRTLFYATTTEDIEFCLNRGDNIESSRNKTQLWSSSGRAITPFLYHCRVNNYGNIDVVVALMLLVGISDP